MTVLLLLLCCLDEPVSTTPIRISQTIETPIQCSLGWSGEHFWVSEGHALMKFSPTITSERTCIETSEIMSESLLIDAKLASDSGRIAVDGRKVLAPNLQVTYSSSAAFFPQPTKQSISSDGTILVTARRDVTKENIEIWDLHSVEIDSGKKWSLELGRDENNTNSIGAVAISPDNDLVVVTHHNGQIDFVSHKQQKLIQSLKSDHTVGHDIKFSSDGTRVGFVSGGALVVFDTKSMREICSWTPSESDDERLGVVTFDFSKSGDDVYVGFIDWTGDKVSHVVRMSLDSMKKRPSGYRHHGISHSTLFEIIAVHCSPDGSQIATVACSGTRTEISFSSPEAFNGLIRFLPRLLPEQK